MKKNIQTAIRGLRAFMFTPAVSNIFFVSTVSAAGGLGDQVFTWRDWFWPVVNFAILVFVLFFFARKPFKEYFRKRTEIIERSLKEAAEARALAQQALKEVQERLKNIDRETEELVRSARKAGEKEKDAIITEGEHIKDRIIQQAKANIEFEIQKAKEVIKSDAALISLELAEKKIREKLGATEQEELIEDYINRLEIKK